MRSNRKVPRWGLLCVVSVALLIGVGFGALQVSAFRRYLVYSPMVDVLYRRFTPDPKPYPTFRQFLINNFPGFAYAYITQRLVGSERDPEVVIHTLTRFVHENLFVPDFGYAVVDDAPITVLHRGIGWCDQQANILLRLLDQRNIPSRLVFLRDQKGVTPHSVGEVYLKGAWRIVDPLMMLILRNSREEIATREEICQGEVDFGAFSSDRISLPKYRQLFCQKPTWFGGNKALRRPGFFEAIKLGKPFPGKTMADSWQRLFAMPDVIGSGLFINLYVQAIRDLYETEDGYAYGVARTYHILGKFQEAQRWYSYVVTAFPTSTHVEESLFFTGLAAYHGGQYGEARVAFDKLLHKYPKTPWAGRARLFSGKALLALGQQKQAKL
ncbi:MAG: hypothetical protein J3T61_00905 [Candidatus Brocadiales bacterium]|nr:hypothetical protein [Candidatus Bathyanammoxibius sp.]